MSRKAEFLAVVKTIVDKDSNKKVKQSTIELAQELSDVLNEINVKPDTDDFKELKDVFNEQLAEMGKQPIVFSENTLKGIASQFANAISDGIKAGMAEGNSEIKSLLKERTDLEDAYNNRNKNGRGSKTKVKTKLAKDIRAAFDYEPAEKAIGIGANLKSIKNEYDAATGWEHQYIALLKYIKAYKALENISKDKSTLEKWGNIGGYSIDQLKRSEAAIQSSLQNIFNIAYDKPLIGLTQDGTIDVNVELKLIKTLDAYDVTGGEGSIKVEVEPVIKKSKKNSTPNAFRGVHRPDTSEGKSYSRDFLGGEFWTDRSGKDFFMQSYGFESGDDGAANLSAVFRPLNELSVDAFSDNGSLQFHQIDKIKLLQYLFPGIEKFLNVANPDGRDNVQKFYNEMARQAGFDLFEVTNVDEGGDELATTLVPLQERIIEYASKIPEYYDVTKFTPEIERVIISQQKGTSERWYDETISRLKSELNKAIQDEDVNKINDLKELIPQLQSMRQAAMDAFDKAIVSYGGYIEDEVKRGLPQVIKTTDNGELIGTISEGSLKNLLEEYGELNQKAANWDDNSGTDKEFKALNDRMKEIKENLLFSLSNDLKDEANEILTDFEFGDKTLDETYQYFKPKLSYSDNLSEQPIESLRKTADETEGEQKANEVAAKAAQEKAKADNDAAEAAKKAADAAEREKSAKEETAKAEREAADTRRTELVKQLDEYGVDTKNADQAQLNLDQREQIHKALVDENLITDEIEEKYLTVNKRLEDRLALLNQIREHEHNINGIPGDGLITNEDDPQVYYEEWFKPFTSDVENMRKSGLFSTEEIEHYNIRLAEMQDYLQSIALEALNNYLINPDEVDDAQKLNEILNQRQKILATVEQFDNPLDSPSSYEEAIKLNQAIKDRISLLQQSRVGATEDSEIAVNQKKIESYEELCKVAKRYNELVFKGSSKTDDEREELDALRERIDATKGERTPDQMIDDTIAWSRMVGPMGALPVEKLARYLGIEIPQAARVAEGAVGNLNSELREGQSLMSQTSKSSVTTGTGDASSEELKSLQDKNEQLRQEKESAEKDKKAANERANEAESEAERLRNELANRDKTDSEKPTSGTASINTSELESLLGRVTYKVKFEGESPLDNSAAVLETVKSALSNIQINASADKDAPWAREDTLKGNIQEALNKIRENTAGLSNVNNDSTDNNITNKKNPYLLTDSNGKTLVVYRGVRDSIAGLTSNRTGTFGTDKFDVAKGYTHGDGKILAYNVEMHNPLEIQGNSGTLLKNITYLGNAFEGLTNPIIQELKDLLSQLSTLKAQLKTAIGFDKNVTIPQKIKEVQARIDEISKDESHPYGVGGTDLFARKAKKNGYDGVIFRDIVDPSSTATGAERQPSNIIVTFDEKQMHLIETLSIKDDEDITQQPNKNVSTIPEANVDNSLDTKTSITIEGLRKLLESITYNIKNVSDTDEPSTDNKNENPENVNQGPWALEQTLSTIIKNILEQIQTNTYGLSDALKNVSIGPKSESKENDNIVVAKDSKNTKNKHGSISHGKADGESNSPQKILDYYYWLEEQMEQFKNNTMYYNALKETYDSITPKINELIEDVLIEAEEKYGPDKNPPWLDSLIEKHELHMAKIKGGEEYSDSISAEKKALDILNEEYRLKSEIFNLEQKGATQNDLAPLYEKLGIYESIRSAIENGMDDNELTRYSVQAANVQNKGETKLTAAEIKANIKTRAEEAKKAAQSVKEEAAAVQELDELYQQLAQAKAMADAETDSVLRRPYEDRVNQLQSEIDAKEANIDRTKYSQQFDNTQKESYKKQIVEELLELYTKLGEAEAKEDRMSIGNATAQQNKSEMDALYKRIEATQKLIDVNEELQNQFDAARKTASDKVVAKADKADAVSDDKSFEKLGKQYEKLGKLRAQAQSTGSAVTQEDARQLEEVIKKEQERLSLSKEQTEELKRRLEVARQNELLRQNSIKQQKSFEQQIKDSRNKARLNTVNSTVRTSQDVLNNAMTIEGLSPESINRIKELSIEVNKLQNKYTEINDKGGVVSDEDQKDVVNQIANVKKLSSEVNDLVKEYNNMSGDNAKTIGKFSGQLNGTSIDEYERQLTEAVMAATNGKASIKGFDAETKTLTYSLKTGSHEFTNYTAAVRGADGALVSIQKETKRTETFIESLTRKTKEIGTYLISSLSLYDVVNKFRQGIQYVREIDSALVELKKVTDETEESYDRFLQTASKTGAKIGSTISDYTRATATFAKLGYSIDMASEMAEAAIIYQNVGDGIESADAAAESIISTMKGFGLQASDAMSIVDKFNQVGNEFSITSKGIGDALQRSASALSEGNNTLDESIGLITAANSVVQDPETVGKAMCRR